VALRTSWWLLGQRWLLPAGGLLQPPACLGGVLAFLARLVTSTLLLV
jgi:hypothetical protein